MTRRLNLGSGPHYAEGWTNVDLHVDADIKASIFELDQVPELEPHCFDQIYLGHLLEHLEWDRVPEALLQVERLLTLGGQLCVVGPCLLRAYETAQPAWLIRSILADPRLPNPPGENHLWTPTEELTLEAVRSVFPQAYATSVSSITKPDWPNPDTALWQCAVLVDVVPSVP